MLHYAPNDEQKRSFSDSTHIVPESKDGTSEEQNLCLACSCCNQFKHDRTHALDPVTGQRVQLFNPRQQGWADHFRWSEDGTQIIGLTSCGRGTIEALRLNNPLIIGARRNWVEAGWHPPSE